MVEDPGTGATHTRLARAVMAPLRLIFMVCLQSRGKVPSRGRQPAMLR